jgi:hypothetical protein
LIGIEFLSLMTFAPSYTPVVSTQIFYPSAPSLQFLQHDRSPFRVVMPGLNLGAVYDLSEVAGYDSMAPLRLVQLLNADEKRSGWGNSPVRFKEDLNSRVTDLLNVKYVLLPPGAMSPGPKFRTAYDDWDARIFRNTEVLPRAFLARRARSCMSDDLELRTLRGSDLNLRDEVVIDGCLAVSSSDQPQTAPVVERYEPELVVVHADVQGSAFLVLTDSYDAGWQVRIDGREASMLRADYAFRAVALGSGSHQVEFSYRPRSFRLGLILSLAGLIAIAALLAYPRRWLG